MSFSCFYILSFTKSNTNIAVTFDIDELNAVEDPLTAEAVISGNEESLEVSEAPPLPNC